MSVDKLGARRSEPLPIAAKLDRLVPELSRRPLAAFTLYPHVDRLLLRSLHVPSNSLNMTTSFIVLTLNGLEMDCLRAKNTYFWARNDSKSKG
jgi:hypothetical protein